MEVNTVSNKQMADYLKERGIKHETTIPYTPEQNGKAERMNRTLVEQARCLLSDSGFEKKFWAEAINTAAYLVNRSSCNDLVDCMTPEGAWSGRKPNLKFLRIFGCQGMVHVPKHKRKKFDFKREECILIGYCENSKGYRLYNPVTKEFQISRDVKFFEDRKLNQSEREVGDFFMAKEKPSFDEQKVLLKLNCKKTMRQEIADNK